MLISDLYSDTILTEAKANSIAAANNAGNVEGEVYKVSASGHGFIVSLYDADGFVGTL